MTVTETLTAGAAYICGLNGDVEFLKDCGEDGIPVLRFTLLMDAT